MLTIGNAQQNLIFILSLGIKYTLNVPSHPEYNQFASGRGCEWIAQLSNCLVESYGSCFRDALKC